MAADSADKRHVRSIWVDAVRRSMEGRVDRSDAVPIYLTLAGADGRDLTALVDARLLRLTEVGSIDARDSGRFIAVESNSDAVLLLTKRFPGLKILEQPIAELLHGSGLTTWPTGKHRLLFGARVVNLDLNTTLKAKSNDGQTIYPILEVVRKILTLHDSDPHATWTLCMTLHGELHLTPTHGKAAQQYLADNFRDYPEFADAFRTFFASGFDRISESQNLSLRHLAIEDQQRFLMAFVPKKIAEIARGLGWKATTRNNMRYGGSHGRAPMVSWVIDFEWDTRSTTTPNVVYRESLGTVLERVSKIEQDGSVS